RAVFVFVLSANGWEQQAKLEAPSDAADQAFGEAVAISGNTVIVGARSFSGPGPAYVYVRSGTSWSAPVALAPDDGVDGDWFGAAVAISGDTAVVGAPFAETGVNEWGTEGAVYVFTRSGSSWLQTKKLFLLDGLSNDAFGASVALTESTLLVGSPTYPEGAFQGAAYFFGRSGTEWSPPQRVKIERPKWDEFGYRVALSQDLAVVGARSYPIERPEANLALADTGDRVGAAFAYERSASGWTQLGDGLFADDRRGYDWFGTSVAVSNGRVMVGAPGADTVYLYEPLASSAVDGRIGRRGLDDFFGGSIAFENDVAVVGSEYGRNGAYVTEFLVPDGGSCGADSDCRARHCVAGACCNAACSGVCESCSSGTCTPLPGTPCGSYLCTAEGGDCPTTCVAHVDCVDTHYCQNGACVPREESGASCREARTCASRTCIDEKCGGTLEIGRECSNAAECESGFCVDGYCCNEQCRGQCEACDLRGARGTCSPVEGAPHGARAACDGSGICAGRCDGEHTARCSYATAETPCGNSCSNGEQTNEGCNGQGACEERERFSCAPYVCAGDGECGSSCERTADCAAGYTCSNGSCEPRSTCANAHTAESPDGTTEDCSPYLCADGGCKSRCDFADDCVEGYACHEDECVLAPSRSRVSKKSGGCNVGKTHASEEISALVSVLLVALAAMGRGSRRGRSKRRRNESEPDA
ncbi:MAG TPA: FG-GAP repeat protein, partial [Polyangiaceae bacterium]